MKITANSYDELMTMYQSRIMLREDLGLKSSEKDMELLRELRTCFNKGKEQEETVQLIKDFTDYRHELKDSGIQDWQVIFPSIFWD